MSATTQVPASYSRLDLQADLLAGATVALVGLPQCLAYATMSGLPPAYGLATAAVPGLVAAIAGRSRHIITGPTNTTGLLVLGALVPFLDQGGLLRPEGLAWLATLTLLCGVVRFAFALGGGPVVIRFLPDSVLAGFTVGAGILIGIMQLDEALGMPAVSGAGIWAEARGLLASLAGHARPAPFALVVTFASIAGVAVGRRHSPRFPSALVTVVAASALAWALRLDASRGLPLVGDRAAIPGGWPAGAMPDLRLSTLGALTLPSFAIVLLGTLELIVSARADDTRADMRREIAAQGWANVVGAFTSAFPASASLTRSVLLRMGHPRSRTAAAAAAALTVPILLLASRVIAYIPQSALAGILLVTAYAMVQQPSLGRMWKASAASRLLFGATAVSTLVLPLTYAVFVGVGLGLIIHLGRTSRPRVRALTFSGERLVPVAAHEAPDILVLEVSGSVHFAAAEALVEAIEKNITDGARIVILDLSHAHELRYTALRALERCADDAAGRGIQLRLAGVEPEVGEMLAATGSHLVFTFADPEPGRSAWRCVQGGTKPR